MYAGQYQILKDVSRIAFGAPLELVSSDRVSERAADDEFIAVFGQRWGRELRLPKRRGRGAYFVDWILARLTADYELIDFTAVEVQTIDTTGNYREEFRALSVGREFPGKSTASPNWENVNKRILPQIIYKGHVLRREPKCSKGLFFVSPTPVYERIRDRLGGNLDEIHPSSGSLTFLHYSLGAEPEEGGLPLVLSGAFTTTVDQVALAFTSPRDLPPARSYEEAIQRALIWARRRPIEFWNRAGAGFFQAPKHLRRAIQLRGRFSILQDDKTGYPAKGISVCGHYRKPAFERGCRDPEIIRADEASVCPQSACGLPVTRRDPPGDRDNLKGFDDGHKGGVVGRVESFGILTVSDHREISALVPMRLQKNVRPPVLPLFTLPLEIDEEGRIEGQRLHLSAGGASVAWASSKTAKLSSLISPAARARRPPQRFGPSSHFARLITFENDSRWCLRARTSAR